MKQDWLRNVLMVTFSGYLLHQIYYKTNMLLERELGFAEIEADSQGTKFPAITFCPTRVANPGNDHKVGNITADYNNLRGIKDMLLAIRQKININEYVYSFEDELENLPHL